MTRTLSAVTVALGMGLGILSTATAVPAQPAAGHSVERKEGSWFQRRLGLSDEQVAQIREIRARDSESGKQLSLSLRRAQTELRQLALGGADPTSLQQKMAEVQQLLGQVLERRVLYLQEIAPILTPEQREKLAQFSAGSPYGRWRHRGPGERRSG
jgi:Spy/CpxP family protein refolding chaperone